ncbi:MAG: trigger factor [Clostridiales bacterium]|jgi:trigger factor|nr:trigger factor [Clostridiales bacterium]
MITNAKVIENNKGILKFEFEIEPKIFKNAIQKVYDKKRKSFKIPGFRNGKVPRAVLEKFYGKNMFYSDAVNEILPEKYDEIEKKMAFNFIEKPKIEISKISEENGITFIATVAILPEFEIGEYKGIKVQRKNFSITSHEVDEELEKQRKKNAREIVVEDRPVQVDDFVNIDYEIFLNDKQEKDKSLKNFVFQVGSNQVISGFGEKLIGKSLGEEIEFNLNFPNEFYDKDLEGKNGKFKIKINKIWIQELPILNDEFAKDVSEFDTLEELKTNIMEKLEGINRIKVENMIENDILEKIVKRTEVVVPDVMVEKELKKTFENYFEQLNVNGFDVKKFLESMDENEKNKHKSAVQNSIKTRIIIDKIMKIENIKVSEEEILNEYNKLSQKNKIDVKKIKNYISKENIAYDIKTRKVLKLLKDKAIIIENN